jgi:hypothetical protein
MNTVMTTRACRTGLRPSAEHDQAELMLTIGTSLTA